MSRIFFKPTIIVSKCLGFEPCRYNGQMEKDEFIERLKQYVDIKTVCPEVSIGLGIPRESIRIVASKEVENLKLMQPKTGIDVYKSMKEFSEEFVNNVHDIDGFILKSRSPSCGIKDVKVYSSIEKSASSVKGKGIFASSVLNKFPNLAIEDEGRLRDYKIRDHFLTKLYIMSEFRAIKKEASLSNLIKFHSNNKLLLMSYNQKELKILGSILGNQKHSNFDEILKQYEEHLGMALSKAPRYTSNINVLIRSTQYFSDKLTSKEKAFILDLIEKYRNERVPLSTPLYVIKSYVVRFDEENLINQTFFEPYPEALVEVRDSGKSIH
jgi:uncharacterized protein YbgA (DUF1722 family)/uncharacterized protein YbbK (DUF523 family)